MSHDTVRERWWSPADRDPIHLAAADWFARLRDPSVSLEETLVWQSWMEEDPRHAEAFQRIEEVSAVLQSVAKPARPRGLSGQHPEYDGSVALRDWHRPPGRAVFAWAASILLTIGAVTLMAVYRGTLLQSHAAATVFATALGENRSVQLADGSQIVLGGSSQVTVSLGERAREIELTRGEAYFTVAKDPTRPFSVHVGRATVTAVGTQFNVLRGQDRVVVDVVEGRVVVEPTSGWVPLPIMRAFHPKLLPVHVSAGQETKVVSAEVTPAATVADVAAVASWQSGHLAFRAEPLRYALEEINRYAMKPIVLGDADIGELKVTGTAAGNNISGWVASLQSAFGILAVEEQDEIVLQRPR